MREYYLISKIYGQTYNKYKGDAIRLSHQLPYLVDEVVIGIKGKIGQERKITTFKDSEGNILERVFDYFDKPLKNQIHKRKDFTKGDDLFITSDSVSEYSLKRKLINYYKESKKSFEELNMPTLLWNRTKIENNHTCENINTGEKVFSRTSVENIEKPTKQIHSFIEFPHILNGKRQNDSKKMLQVRVNSNKAMVTEVLTQQGVQKPEQDSFLAFRALDFGETKTAITNFFIKQRGLSRMNISIDPEYQTEGESIDRLSGFFDPSDGCIGFNKYYKYKSKQSLVSTGRHEVEHAWQYYLDARNIGGRSMWGIDIFFKFGRIRKKELKIEAEKYTESIQNYISYSEDYQKYKQNYIEVKAHEAGDDAKTDYETQSKEIRESFPFIPEEML